MVGVETAAVVAHFAAQGAIAIFQVQVHARLAGGFAGVGRVVQQGLQQVGDGRIDPQAGRQGARALQVDGRPDQAPLPHHANQVHGGWDRQIADAFPAQGQQLAEGGDVLFEIGLLDLGGDLVGQQGHGGQRGVQFVRHRRRVGGQGDDALVAGETLAQPRQFAFARPQVGGQAGGEHQHDHHGNQEVGAQAPQQQGVGVNVAAQRLTEDGGGEIAGDPRQRRGQRPVARQRQRRQGGEDQEHQAERIAQAAAPAHHPGQHGHVHQQVPEGGGVGQVAAVAQPQAGVDVEADQHAHADPQRLQRQGQAQHAAGHQDGGGLARDGEPAQAAEGTQEGKGGTTGHIQTQSCRSIAGGSGVRLRGTLASGAAWGAALPPGPARPPAADVCWHCMRNQDGPQITVRPCYCMSDMPL